MEHLVQQKVRKWQAKKYKQKFGGGGGGGGAQNDTPIQDRINPICTGLC